MKEIDFEAATQLSAEQQFQIESVCRALRGASPEQLLQVVRSAHEAFVRQTNLSRALVMRIADYELGEKRASTRN